VPEPPIDDAMKALFQAEARYPEEPAEAKAAAWESLAAGLGLGTAVVGATTGAAVGAATGRAALAAKVAIFVAGGLVGSAATLLVDASLEEPEPPSRVEHVARAAEPPPDEAASEPRTEPPAPVEPPAPQELDVRGDEPPREATPRPRERTPRMSATGERELIDAARAALVRGRTANALATLRRHRREFPSGALVEERDALVILALARSGDGAQAATRAERFSRRYPRSIFAPAIEAALE